MAKRVKGKKVGQRGSSKGKDTAKAKKRGKGKGKDKAMPKGEAPPPIEPPGGDDADEGKRRRAPQVVLVMGSDSDLPRVEGAFAELDRFGVRYEARILSAHRTPVAVEELIAETEEGCSVYVAAAGGAAHLAGAVAARTTRPVIGIPLDSSPLLGLDALLATVQMPPGVPVATVSVGAWGARNAALLACQILGVSDPAMAERLREHKAAQRDKVLQKDATLQAQRGGKKQGKRRGKRS